MNFFAVELQQFNDRRHLFSTQAWLALPFFDEGDDLGDQANEAFVAWVLELDLSNRRERDHGIALKARLITDELLDAVEMNLRLIERAREWLALDAGCERPAAAFLISVDIDIELAILEREDSLGRNDDVVDARTTQLRENIEILQDHVALRQLAIQVSSKFDALTLGCLHAIALLSHIKEQRTCEYDENSDKENIDDDLLHGSSYEVLPVAWRPAR